MQETMPPSLQSIFSFTRLRTKIVSRWKPMCNTFRFACPTYPVEGWYRYGFDPKRLGHAIFLSCQPYTVAIDGGPRGLEHIN